MTNADSPATFSHLCLSHTMRACGAWSRMLQAMQFVKILVSFTENDEMDMNYGPRRKHAGS
jgi:hypothetical protein